MPIDKRIVATAIARIGIGGRPVMAHSSLKALGVVVGGASAVVGALLDRRRTVLVPAFSSGFGVPMPSDRAPLQRNGVDPGFEGPTVGVRRVYTPACGEIDRDMGAVAAAIVGMPDGARGMHPLNSFAAAGPDARKLVAGQTGMDVYAPIRELADRGGYVVLMGVGLESMTALHLAEQMAGRRLFRRWANGPDGEAMELSVGGCSRGFGALDPVLSKVERTQRVGNGLCRAFPLRELLTLASAAIASRPEVTRCTRADCVRCADAVAGGPVQAPPIRLRGRRTGIQMQSE
ncbi:MAG: AAC(3) family N-acetyltransferase [Gammaproteobacteria bacterium]|nr:AAC(3) family N-acetyltransferase [Gammaproteobacteria bacterium]